MTTPIIQVKIKISEYYWAKKGHINYFKIICKNCAQKSIYIYGGYDVPLWVSGQKIEKEAHCDRKGVLDVFE